MQIPDPRPADPASAPPEASAALVLSDRLDNDEATALRDRLLALRFQPLVVDARALTGLGILPAQVLAAAAAQWRADRQAFRLVASDGCRRDMVNLGLGLQELTLGED